MPRITTESGGLEEQTVATQISDVEYITRILDNMKGQSNVRTARKIAILFGGRIRQRVRDGKPCATPAPGSSEPNPRNQQSRSQGAAKVG